MTGEEDTSAPGTPGPGPEGVVRSFQAAIATGDWDAASSTLHPDVVFHEAPTLPFGGDHHGVDGYRALAEEFAALAEFSFSPEVRVTTTADGEVVVRGAFTVTGRATGRTASTPFAEFYRFEGGRIVDVDVFYWDEAAVIGALVDRTGGAA